MAVPIAGVRDHGDLKLSSVGNTNQLLFMTSLRAEERRTSPLAHAAWPGTSMAKLAILAALCAHQGVAVETYRMLMAVGAMPLGRANPDGPRSSHVPARYQPLATCFDANRDAGLSRGTTESARAVGGRKLFWGFCVLGLRCAVFADDEQWSSTGRARALFDPASGALPFHLHAHHRLPADIPTRNPSPPRTSPSRPPCICLAQLTRRHPKAPGLL